MFSISISVAFIAGLVSFIAPCVLPIIPGFLAYLAGSGGKGGGAEAPRRLDVFFNSVFFVLGFSIVFAVLGVLLNGVLSSVATGVQVWLSRIGGVLIIFFGLYLTGLLHVSFLDRPHVFKVGMSGVRSKYVTSFLFGLAFAAGWTPCVGATLGAILGLATTAPGSAFSLLLAYALGLGIPFLIVGFFATEASGFISRYEKFSKNINILFGALLIVIGILIFTNNLSAIANFEFLNQLILK
ncbi:MAG: cytochrome c biogenesis protein CcdA [Candidatus Taylorbacteria bacterium]|nr:cytochrome c biogenesis protein CcdA [Candidatus Taylorbacteria bacterium]